METMGDRIHKKRIELGMTMDELGAKVGVQKSAVNKWEKNVVSNMKRSVISELATALEVTPIWLMYGDNPPGLQLAREMVDQQEVLKFYHELKDVGIDISKPSEQKKFLKAYAASLVFENSSQEKRDRVEALLKKTE